MDNLAGCRWWLNSLLNTEALAPGLYLLRVQYAGQTVTRRVVLE